MRTCIFPPWGWSIKYWVLLLGQREAFPWNREQWPSSDLLRNLNVRVPDVILFHTFKTVWLTLCLMWRSVEAAANKLPHTVVIVGIIMDTIQQMSHRVTDSATLNKCVLCVHQWEKVTVTKLLFFRKWSWLRDTATITCAVGDLTINITQRTKNDSHGIKLSLSLMHAPKLARTNFSAKSKWQGIIQIKRCAQEHAWTLPHTNTHTHTHKVRPLCSGVKVARYLCACLAYQISVAALRKRKKDR